MGYVIVGGVGLAIGIGFLVWALRERAKRHDAERSSDRALTRLSEAISNADRNATVAKRAAENVERIEGQLAILRGRLNEARSRLRECHDPEAVASWLDSELKEEDI